MAGRYYVTKKLRSNSSTVFEEYAALDATVKTGKPQEFKVLRFRSEHCANREFVAALEAEVNAALPLRHSNILELSACGVWDKGCFLVYENLETISLAEIPKQALDAQVVANISVKILDALTYLHESSGKRPQTFQSGFHPNSVLITPDGGVKLRWFHTAAIRKAGRPNALDTILGRTPYLPPEVLSGGGGASADLHSLGILLWELLTGERYSAGANSGEKVPSHLSSFIEKLLHKDSTQQYKYAAEAKAALEKILFTIDAKGNKNPLNAWASTLPFETDNSEQRKVIAEIVATRELQKTLLNAPEPSPKEEDAPQKQTAKTSGRAPAPQATPWGKNVSFHEAPKEPEEEKLIGPTVPKPVLKALAALGALTALGVAIWIYFPDGNPFAGLVTPLVEKSVSSSSDGKAIQAAFAYRASDDPSRSVIIQGLRQESTDNFVKECGENGEGCSCEFFLAADDSDPNASSPAAISRKYNYLHCSVPEGNSSRFVRVTTAGKQPRMSNVLSIATTLSWSKVLGPALTQEKIRWVYHYECERTFFEGEGVDANGALSCPPMQNLGVIRASYDYYFYRPGQKPAGNTEFKGAICNLESYVKARCLGDGAQLHFGLYSEERFPFVVPISLYHAPEGEETMASGGYAAGPDKNGNCPAGMILLRHWVAESLSIPNSSFINKSGELSNRKYLALQPRPFEIVRQKNRTPCDNKGDCSLFALEEAASAGSVPYSKQMDLCVLSPSLLDGPQKSEEASAKTLGHTLEAAPEATVEIRTTTTDFEVTSEGKKVPLQGNKIRVPLHKAFTFEITKAGCKPVHLKVAPLETASNFVFDVSLDKVPVGTIDLDSFPASQVSFWLGDEMIFSGNTPIKETLPAGKYKIKFKALRSGAEAEREVTIGDGKNVVVDQIISEKKK